MGNNNPENYRNLAPAIVMIFSVYLPILLVTEENNICLFQEIIIKIEIYYFYIDIDIILLWIRKINLTIFCVVVARHLILYI